MGGYGMIVLDLSYLSAVGQVGEREMIVLVQKSSLLSSRLLPSCQLLLEIQKAEVLTFGPLSVIGIEASHNSSTPSPSSLGSFNLAKLTSHAFPIRAGSNPSLKTLIFPHESHPAGMRSASLSSTFALYGNGNLVVTAGGGASEVGLRGGGVVYSWCKRYFTRVEYVSGCVGAV
jgi:hypothetical protein